MGAISSSEAFNSVHRDAVTRANSWRGRCINLFARGERVVTQALMAAGKPGRLPLLLGQKVERLAQERSGHPEALKAIERFKEFIELRNAIVHSEGRVFADLKGDRILQLENWSGGVIRQISGYEAENLRREVQQAVDKLASRLDTSSQTPDRGDTLSA